MTDSLDNKSIFKRFFKAIPIATLIIGGLLLVILIGCYIIGFNMPNLIGDILQRFIMWGLLVLAMVPSIQSGVGPNFALPVGIVAGLISVILSIEMGLEGGALWGVAFLLAVVIGCIFGYIYGKLMNAVKGSEMAIATYTGFAITWLFCMIWLVLPVRNQFISLFLGKGLRQYVALNNFAANQYFDNILQFHVFGVQIRTGAVLIIIVACVLMWLFFRSKAGIAITAVGMNPTFARAAGLNVDRSRIIANMISTSLAAMGIIMYMQSFGYMELYQAPLLMAFSAVASVLVGGASAQRAKVVHVVIGTLVFQGLLTTGTPFFNRLFSGADFAEPVKGIIQYGVILFALTQMKGGTK